MSNQPSQALDRQLMFDRVSRDPTLLRETLQDFLQFYPGMMDALRIAIEAEQAPDVQRNAHSLKTVAATFGALGARETALAIENRGRNAALEGAKADYATLARDMDRLAAEVRTWLDELGTVPGPMFS